MGWQGREITIPVDMIFGKKYCYKCGERLKKQMITKEYARGEKEFHTILPGTRTIGMDSLKSSTFVYVCPKCNAIITYDEQRKISKIQKCLKKKTLSDTDFK